MNKGGKRYFNKNKRVNWFNHTDDTSQTGQSHDMSTSSGSVLTKEPYPLTQAEERYPKIFINPETKTMGRKYPFSVHDNRTALQQTIDVYDQGLGRKKCLDERRQHNSHFHLCHEETQSPDDTVKWDYSVNRTDFLPRQEAADREDPIRRRFPRNHSARSQMNAPSMVEERFIWFGRDDSNQHIPLSVLADSNHTK